VVRASQKRLEIEKKKRAALLKKEEKEKEMKEKKPWSPPKPLIGAG
jgi:hypothetical protein